MSSLSQRPTYNRLQLSQWLNLVGQGKSSISLGDLEADIKQNPLRTLSRIQLWQLAAVPFGNLVLHYSPHHTVCLDADSLFTKIVERKLGGYCMENNTFFATVLRSLRYEVYTTGARVSDAINKGHSDSEGYGGWSHMVNIVTVDGRKYVIDVGFGNSGPTQPIRLKDGEIVQNVPISQGRLEYKPIAPFTDPNQRMWTFDVRHSSEGLWIEQYCFSELEFLPQDFCVMNYHTSQSRASWFTHTLILTKFLLSEDREEAVGTLTLSGNEVKRRLHGQSEALVTCTREEERVQALEDYFGVKLRPDEIRGIRGLPSEIKRAQES